jgi:hypothetical protein
MCEDARCLLEATLMVLNRCDYAQCMVFLVCMQVRDVPTVFEQLQHCSISDRYIRKRPFCMHHSRPT